jgi:hypothetical protein
MTTHSLTISFKTHQYYLTSVNSSVLKYVKVLTMIFTCCTQSIDGVTVFAFIYQWSYVCGPGSEVCFVH